MKYKAAIFDMDGLLLDSERISMECFQGACRAAGFKADLDIYIRCIGSNADRTREILTEGYGDCFDYNEVQSHWQELYARQVFENPLPLKSGVESLLKKITSLRIPMSVATSTPHDLAIRKLQHSGILEYFEFVVGGDQVSKSKPDPEIYLTAADRHKVDVIQCIAFEDSENGVRAATLAGMSVIQVPDLVKPTNCLRSLGHRIFDSLASVELD